MDEIEFHFKQAVRFDLAGQLLHHHTIDGDRQIDLLFPSQAIDAFAIELYLKCVLKLENYSGKMDIHTLDGLYDKISLYGKVGIDMIYDKEVKTQPEFKMLMKANRSILKRRKDPSFLELIKQGSNAFVALRYYHEPKSRTKYKGLFPMPIKMAVRKYILTIKPTWEIHRVRRMVW